jgi:hypothetical protein
MGIETVVVGLLPFWLGTAALTGKAARAAGGSGRRWFWLAALLGPVGWMGAYLMVRDAKERWKPRALRRRSVGSKRDEGRRRPHSVTLYLPRTKARYVFKPKGRYLLKQH